MRPKTLKTTLLFPFFQVNLYSDYHKKADTDLSKLTNLRGLVCEKLERLSLEAVSDKSLKALTSLKKLKMLSVTDTTDSDSMIASQRNKPRITDYTAISVMSSLESLHLDSDHIKAIDFIKGLPALTSLSLENTNIFTLEALTGKDSLTTLALTDNYKVADFQPIGTLTSLSQLIIHGCNLDEANARSKLSGVE